MKKCGKYFLNLLAPVSWHGQHSAHSPIDTSENVSAHVSEKYRGGKMDLKVILHFFLNGKFMKDDGLESKSSVCEILLL